MREVAAAVQETSIVTADHSLNVSSKTQSSCEKPVQLEVAPTSYQEFLALLETLDIDVHSLPPSVFSSLLSHDSQATLLPPHDCFHKPLETHERGILFHAYIASLCKEFSGEDLCHQMRQLFKHAPEVEAQRMLLEGLLQARSLDGDTVFIDLIQEGLLSQRAVETVYARYKTKSPAVLRRLETYRYSATQIDRSTNPSRAIRDLPPLERDALDARFCVEQVMTQLKSSVQGLTPFNYHPMETRDLEHALYDLYVLFDRREDEGVFTEEVCTSCLELLLEAAQNYTVEQVPACLQKGLKLFLPLAGKNTEFNNDTSSSEGMSVKQLLLDHCMRDRDLAKLERYLGGTGRMVSTLAASSIIMFSGSRAPLKELLSTTETVIDGSLYRDELFDALTEAYSQSSWMRYQHDVEGFYTALGLEDERVPLNQRLARFVDLLKNHDIFEWQDYAASVFDPSYSFTEEQRTLLLAQKSWSPEQKLSILDSLNASPLSVLHKDPFFASLYQDALLHVEQKISSVLLQEQDSIPLVDVVHILHKVSLSSPIEARRLLHHFLQSSAFKEELKQHICSDGEQEVCKLLLSLLATPLHPEEKRLLPKVDEAKPEKAPFVRMTSLPRLVLFHDKNGQDEAVQSLVALAHDFCYALYRSDERAANVQYCSLVEGMQAFDEDPTKEAVCSLEDIIILNTIRDMLESYEAKDTGAPLVRLLSKGFLRLSDSQDPALRGQQVMFLYALQSMLPEDRQRQAIRTYKKADDQEKLGAILRHKIESLLPESASNELGSIGSLFSRAFGFLFSDSAEEQAETPLPDTLESEEEAEGDAETTETEEGENTTVEASEESDLHPWSEASSVEKPGNEKGRHQQEAIAEISPPLKGKERYLVEALFSEYRPEALEYRPLGYQHDEAMIRAFLREAYLSMQEQKGAEVMIRYFGMEHDNVLPLPTGSVLLPPVARLENGSSVRLQVNNDLGHRFQTSKEGGSTLSIQAEVSVPEESNASCSRSSLKERMGEHLHQALTQAAVSLEAFPLRVQAAIIEAKNIEDLDKARRHVLDVIQASYRYDKKALEHPDYRSHIEAAPYADDSIDHYMAAIHAMAGNGYEGATICGGFTHLAVQALKLAEVPVLYGRGFYVRDSGQKKQVLRSEDKHAFPVVLMLDERGEPLCLPVEATPEGSGYAPSLSMSLPMSVGQESQVEEAVPLGAAQEELRPTGFFEGAVKEQFSEVTFEDINLDAFIALYRQLDVLRSQGVESIQSLSSATEDTEDLRRRNVYEEFFSSWQKLANPAGIALLHAVRDAKTYERYGIEERHFQTFLEYSEREWERLVKHFESFEFDPSIFELP